MESDPADISPIVSDMVVVVVEMIWMGITLVGDEVSNDEDEKRCWSPVYFVLRWSD